MVSPSESFSGAVNLSCSISPIATPAPTCNFLYGLNYLVLRYGNVYGPRQSSHGEAGVFAIFCEQMLAGIQPVIYGDGTKTRDYIFIEDVVHANLAALERGDGEICNIASGIETTDQQVFDVIRHRLGKSDLRAQYVARRPGEIEKIYLDIRKAERVLGWTPQIALNEGARRTVSYFQQAASKVTAQR